MKKYGYLLAVLLLIGCIVLAFYLRKEEPVNVKNNNKPIIKDNINDFDFKIIQETNKLYSKQNYMISPLSIGYALTLLKEGAKESTLNEIDNALNNYTLPSSLDAKDRISIANLIFIKNTHKDDISKNYISLLKEKYDSELMLDEFKTPKPINDWISKKTFNMINNTINEISPDFVLGLANAIAIDVEWKEQFECFNTKEQDFTKEDNTKMKTAMMHGSNDVAYLKNDNAKGIIKNYAIYDKNTGKRVFQEDDNTIALEYIAILPNKSVEDYMKTFDKNELNDLLSSTVNTNNKEIYYSLPKYTYDFDYDKFQSALENIGIKKVFNPLESNLKNMLVENSKLDLYVGQAIHKTHIELSESGTKAAAVTVMMALEATALHDEKEKIYIDFDRPFIYLIKEKNTDNVWFFGTVYEPIKWEDNKCERKDEF